VIVERDLQPEKQDSQISLTEQGIQIVESDEQSQNAKRSRHESLELDSNVIVERDLHLEKQEAQILLTEQGIQILESDEQLLNA
jgi:predicted transcriptional regulator